MDIEGGGGTNDIGTDQWREGKLTKKSKEWHYANGQIWFILDLNAYFIPHSPFLLCPSYS